MKKTLLYFTLIFLAGFLACKKDTGPVPPAGPSARYKALTSHYWRFVGNWFDTTAYAKAHPEQVPLPTSTNELSFADSCSYYSCAEFNPNGRRYVVQGTWCGCSNTNLCKPDDGIWKLSNQDQTLLIDEYYTVIDLNDTTLRFYALLTYNLTKKLVAVYKYKPYVFK